MGSVRSFLEKSPSGWRTPPASVETTPGVESGVTARADGSLLFSGKVKSKGSTVLRVEPERGWVASVRLELLPTEEHQ